MNNEGAMRGNSRSNHDRIKRRSTFNDNRSYSPSANYNLGKRDSGSYNGNNHPRRRVDRFKRANINYNEKLVKQNDIIIRLLKEIKERLPEKTEKGKDNMSDKGGNSAGNESINSRTENDITNQDSELQPQSD